jgi:hypothetical protein
MSLYNLADTSYKTQVFYNTGYWVKPQGITMISITCIGAGGAGGCPIVGPTGGNSGSGGGAGGSGAISTTIIPAWAVTDTLYVYIASGGTGTAVANTAGGPGEAAGTFVRLVPRGVLNSANLAANICFANSGLGGAAVAAGGAGGTISTGTNMIAGNTIGVCNFYAGVNGGNSGGPPATQQWGTTVVTGGGGGGNVAAATAFSGGTVSGNTFVPTVFGGSASTNINGQDGIFSLTPFYSLGGGGGATQIGAPGGNGGRGAIGSGGGGAGAGSSRGRSGNGGNGLVIINCW